MKFVSPSHEVSLAVVRQLSEHAVTKPWDRTLRCATWPRASLHKDVPVYQPWRSSALTMWRGFVGKRDASQGTENPMKFNFERL